MARVLPGSVAFVLAPVGPAARDAWSKNRFAQLGHPEIVDGAIAALASVQDELPPQPLGMLALLLDFQNTVGRRTLPGPEKDPPALARAALALRSSDPALAAFCLELCASRTLLGGTIERDPARQAQLLDWLEQARDACDAARRASPPLNDHDNFWADGVDRRCANCEADLAEKLARASDDPARRRQLLERTLVAARRTVAVDERGGLAMIERDKERVVRVLFELDRRVEAATVYRDGPRRDAIRAELARLAGDASGAVEILEPQVARADNRELPDVLAVLALAQADLGRFDAARATAAQQQKLEDANGPNPTFDRWRAKELVAAIERAEKAR